MGPDSLHTTFDRDMVNRLGCAIGTKRWNNASQDTPPGSQRGKPSEVKSRECSKVKELLQKFWHISAAARPLWARILSRALAAAAHEQPACLAGAPHAPQAVLDDPPRGGHKHVKHALWTACSGARKREFQSSCHLLQHTLIP